MPLTKSDFLDEERHHQVAALHRPPCSAGGAGASLYHDYQQDDRLHHNSHQSSRNNSLWSDPYTGETIQSGGQGSSLLMGMTRLDLQKGLYRSQVVSRHKPLQHFIPFSMAEPSGNSDKSLRQEAAPPEMLMTTSETILEDIHEILFDDDEAPSSSQKAQVAASRRPGATNQEGQQQTRDYVNPSPPRQAWQRYPAISGMMTSTRNHPSSLVTAKVATVTTNTQGRQHALAGKKGLKRTCFELNDYSPCAKNAPDDSSAALFMTEKNVPVTKKPRHCTPVDDESKSEEGESHAVRRQTIPFLSGRAMGRNVRGALRFSQRERQLSSSQLLPEKPSSGSVGEAATLPAKTQDRGQNVNND
jgi:hypothetical protein